MGVAAAEGQSRAVLVVHRQLQGNGSDYDRSPEGLRYRRRILQEGVLRGRCVIESSVE